MQQNTDKVKKKQKSVRKRNDYNKKNYWVQGEILTEKDQMILEEVKLFYLKNGYIPSKKEISNSVVLKSRFRTWKEVLMGQDFPAFMMERKCVKDRKLPEIKCNRIL